MRATFTKDERLSSRKTIAQLFTSGRSFSIHPFRLIWDRVEPQSAFPVQLAISVPKRKMKRAVDRNVVKRRIREAYRKNKWILYEPMSDQDKQLAVMIVYQSSELPLYPEVEHKIILTLQRLASIGIK